MTRVSVAAALISVLLAARPAAAAPARNGYAHELVQKARSARLAETKTWLRLGHYRKTLFGGFESEVDGEPFFLAPDGKSDPAAELEATLRGFFAGEPRDRSLEHPQCRFPARLAWLERELHIDWTRLPRRPCPRYAEFLERLKPVSFTLIFSSYYLNNPASAFGHTFLRVNKAGASEREGRELLDYGIDFSAIVDTGNAVLYAFKGLLGLFPGKFNKVPYYYKVQEYNDFESRDLWEYELSLTTDEVRFVVAHLWELGSTYFAYYYLSENCSYHILGALEVANPKLELVEHVGWPVVPADTVKALLKNPGLVRRIDYRPSNRSRFRARVDALTTTELEFATALMHDPRAPFPEGLTRTQRIKVLDTAIDLEGVRAARELVKERSQMDEESIEREQTLLERRASFGVASPEAPDAAPRRQMPHLGHGSSRLGLGSGWDDRRDGFHTLSYRLALHDLADPAPGYPEHAAIEFLPMSFRYYVKAPRLTLEDVSLIRVRSLSPWSRFERPLAWMVDVGARRTRDRSCDDCLSAFAELGGGVALEPFGRFFTVFALVKGELAAPAKGGFFDWLRVGFGPFGGLRLRFSDEIAALFTGSYTVLPWQDARRVWDLEGKIRAEYVKNFALGIEARLLPTTASAQGVSYVYF